MLWWQRVVGRKQAPAEPPVVLVVDDDAGMFDEVKDALADFGWDFACAEDRRGALAILDRKPRLVTAIVDLYFPGDPVPTADDRDSTGLAIIREVQRRYPGIPCAALSGGLVQMHINKVMRLGATYIAKCDLSQSLHSYGTKVLIAHATSDETLRRCVSAYALGFCLSPRETEMIALAAADVPRADLPRRLGVGNPTVKTQIRSILDKTGAKSIEAIGRTLRLQAREADAARAAKGRTRVSFSWDENDACTVTETPIGPDEE